MDLYLSRELKEYYMEDFETNVLTCTSEFWGLDEGLELILPEINTNPNIQTLYSQRYYNGKTVNRDNSYLRFAYTKEVEMDLFRLVIPKLLAKYCRIGDEVSTLQYDFYPPNMGENDPELGMACRFDNKYFFVNSVKICLECINVFVHDAFWEDTTFELKNLK